MRKKQTGFTLIELMIVIAIIGIIASIAIPAYQDYLARSQMTEALSLASGSKTAVAEFHVNWGRWPPNNASAGVSQPTSIKGKYVSYVSILPNSGVILARLKDTGVATGILGEQLTLSPILRSGSIEWDCSSLASDKYLPTTCRTGN
jgi:type IV pilus assembly protein PilA